MKIITDSGCDFSADMKQKKGINIERVPLSLQIENKNFIDDDDLNLDDFIEEMSNSKATPKTAAPSPQLYMDKFAGDDSVFAITISSKLSASYQNAVIAMDMFLNLEENKNKFIHVFDSLSASIGQTMIAMKINEFINNNFKENEIVEKINNFIGGMKTFILLEKYDNLVKNGRINPYIAKIASMLSIKPICHGVNGEMALLDKARGTQKAMIKLAEIIAADNLDFKSKILGISYVKCLDKAISLKDEILKRAPFKDVILTSAGGLVTTYADMGGMVISY